jgi:hypothetical protein
MEGLAI